MLEPSDLQQIDGFQSSIQDLLDEVVEHYSALTPPEKDIVTKLIRGLDNSWSALLADVGETKSTVPEKSIRALLACGCVMACMVVVQADDEITAAEREVLLHLTSGFSEPLSLSGMTPVSSETSAGTIEYYSHLVDTYDVMDYRVAGTLCAAIDAFRDTKLVAKFARYVTLLGMQISFVDGEGADQRELAVLSEFDESMKQVTRVIKNANL
jgi:tellurite resistance protein